MNLTMDTKVPSSTFVPSKVRRYEGNTKGTLSEVFLDETCAPIKSTKDIIHIAPELEIGEAACKFIYWLSVHIPARPPRFTRIPPASLCDDVLLV